MKNNTNDVKQLFDILETEVLHDLSIFETPYSPIPEVGVVRYMDSRTGRETTTSAGRFYAALTLSAGLRKRFIGATSAPSVSSTDRETNAVLEFLEDNARCAQFNRSFRPSDMPDFVQVIFGEVRLLLAETFEDPRFEFTFSRIGCGLVSGPGASSGLPKRLKRALLDAGSYGRLGNSPMSFSHDNVRRLYKAVCNTSRLTYAAEAVRYACYGVDDSVEVPAVFLSVPKTTLKNRGICTQPSGNMALQLSTHSWFCEILRFWGVDLENQQFLNRRLAYYGSRGPLHCKGRSWSFDTWDLSRASNFPWQLIVEVFPPEVVVWLDSIRSHEMLVSLGSSYQCVRKEMCSTMGNGFTFALMTLLLSAIVKALYSYFGLSEYDEICSPTAGVRHPEAVRSSRLKTWAVYGDDIIVDHRLRYALPLVLKHFGFLVNSDKSYTSGSFRESCGADFYQGYNVRPVFVETLDNQADIYSLLNRLSEWSIYHSIPLPRAIHCLRTAAASLGPELRVPFGEDVSAGLRVPPNMAFSDKKCEDLVGAVAPTAYRALSKHGSKLYAALVPKPFTRRVFREVTRKRPWCCIKTRQVYFYTDVVAVKWNTESHPNLYAVLMHMLSGTIRQGTYGVRPRSTTYEVDWRICPNWTSNQDQGVTAVGLRTEYTAPMARFISASLSSLLTPRS